MITMAHLLRILVGLVLAAASQAFVVVDQDQENTLVQVIADLESRLRQLENSQNLSAADEVESAVPSANPYTIARTCSELSRSNPNVPSGEYLVDPDGVGAGDAPFLAYCDMATGTTLVSHDSEETTAITPCFVPGCYSKQIKYKATQRQLSALVELSSDCRQHIKYECLNSALSYNGVAVAWWEDRHGVTNYYWAGSNASSHTCQCGISGNCVKPSVKCNCDAKSNEWQTDEGYIVEKSALPVMTVNYGIVQNGRHTVGKLECSGKVSVSGMPTSCLDLWKLGHTSSGLYTISNATGGFELVYCNMDNLFSTQGAFETAIGKPDVKSKSVYFHAGGIRMSSASDNYFGFTKVLLNIGDALDAPSGIFTVPVTGIYAFSFTCRALSIVDLELRVDNLPVASTDHDVDKYVSVSMSATLKLNKGQVVRIGPKGVATLALHEPYVQFTGALLEEIF